MTDRYTTFANSAAGRAIVGRLGLPNPPVLRRYRPGDPLVDGPVVLGGTGRLAGPVRSILDGAGVQVTDSADGGVAALLYDATGLADPAALRGLYDFFHPAA